MREAFERLDASEGERLSAIEKAVTPLQRSLTVQYREAILTRTLPELRKMRADARAAAEAGRWREAGNLTQATLVATHLIVLEANLVLVGDWAGGVAAATRIDVAVLEEMNEAIRRLLAAGALDPAVVAGMGQLGAAAARPGLTSPASFTMQGLELPDTTAMARVPGKWVPVNESMSDRARAYQVQRGGKPGKAYQVGNVKFDTLRDGKLIEAKGLGYETFVEKKGPPTFREWFSKASDLVRQAQRQAEAGRAAGLPVQWEVAEPRFAQALSKLFEKADVHGITAVHVPFQP